MQTAEHKAPLSPAYSIWFAREIERAEGSGNVKAAIYDLHMAGFAAYETADGLLVLAESHISSNRAAPVCEIEDDLLVEWPSVFPIVAGRVDMGTVAAFIGH
jgi:hypothetical protein